MQVNLQVDLEPVADATYYSIDVFVNGTLRVREAVSEDGTYSLPLTIEHGDTVGINAQAGNAAGLGEVAYFEEVMDTEVPARPGLVTAAYISVL